MNLILELTKFLLVYSQSSETHPVARSSQSVLSDSKTSSVSISTQTDEVQDSTKWLKSAATQTFNNSQSVSQSTPLLSSLICNQRTDESLSSYQETSTSPSPEDSLLAAEGTGEWTGVDGVNGRNVTWDSCAPLSDASQRNVDDDVLQDVFR